MPTMANTYKSYTFAIKKTYSDLAYCHPPYVELTLSKNKKYQTLLQIQSIIQSANLNSGKS